MPSLYFDPNELDDAKASASSIFISNPGGVKQVTILLVRCHLVDDLQEKGIVPTRSALGTCS